MTTAGPHPAPPEAPIRVTFDSRVYALTVIKKAAYRFLDVFACDIRQEGDDWVCLLAFRAGGSDTDIAAAVAELKAEVLDQDLRASVARETEGVRATILALAFSRTGLQGQ